MSTNVVCTACDRASWPVSPAWAEKQIENFNVFYDNASPSTQGHYGGRASLDTYRCFCGGNAFRPALPEDRFADHITVSTVICDELADDPPEVSRC